MKKMITKSICLFLSFLLSGHLRSQTINTFAGTGVSGFNGDGSPATAAELNGPHGVVADGSGNVYITDFGNHRIRKVNASGIISTFAGTGVAGFSGDGGLATAAQLNNPVGVEVDVLGNVYIADLTNQRIRKINTLGIITTLAGNGTVGFSGDGSVANLAQLNNPYGVATDPFGNVYIVEAFNHRVRKINTSGIISTFAGTGIAGYNGDGGMASLAQLNTPTGIVADYLGNVYVADNANNRIRKVDLSGVITTIAGTGVAGYSGDGGLAVSANINGPDDVAVDTMGNVYVADFFNNRIRKINKAGSISTVAGTGVSGFSGDGGLATNAQLSNPTGVAFAFPDNIYIGDNGNDRVRKVTGAVGIKEYEEKISVSIYPNPFQDILNVRVDIASENTIELFDVLGNCVHRSPLENKNTIDLEFLPSGIYFACVKSKEEILVRRKIVKE